MGLAGVNIEANVGQLPTGQWQQQHLVLIEAIKGYLHLDCMKFICTLVHIHVYTHKSTIALCAERHFYHHIETIYQT